MCNRQPIALFLMDEVAGMDMKQLRLRAKLRTVDVASMVGVGESSVRNWEKGRTIPKLTIDKTAALCQLYQCSIVELAQAVAESMAKEIGADLSNEDYSSKSLQMGEIIDDL